MYTCLWYARTEILDYAKWLGMDLDEERELLWIAREGLKAMLPPDWKPCRSPNDDIYYFNFSTGESVWEHPCDKHYKQLFEEERESLRKRRAENGAASSPSPAMITRSEKSAGSSEVSSSPAPRRPADDSGSDNDDDDNADHGDEGDSRINVKASAYSSTTNVAADKAHAAIASEKILVERQEAARNEEERKFKLWQEQLEKSAEERRSAMVAEHERVLADLRDEHRRASEEAKKDAAESEQLRIETRDELEKLRRDAENPAKLDVNVKREAHEIALERLRKQVEDEIQSQFTSIKDEALVSMRARVEDEVLAEADTYRASRQEEIQRTIDEEIHTESAAKKEAALAAAHAQAETEAATRRDEYLRTTADALDTEVARLRTERMARLDRDIDAEAKRLRDEKLEETREEVEAEKSELLKAMRDDIARQHEIDITEARERMKRAELEKGDNIPPSSVSSPNIEDLRADRMAAAIAQIEKEVDDEVRGSRVTLKAEALSNMRIKVDSELQSDMMTYRRDREREMRMQADDELQREMDERRRDALSKLRAELDVQTEKMRADARARARELEMQRRSTFSEEESDIAAADATRRERAITAEPAPEQPSTIRASTDETSSKVGPVAEVHTALIARSSSNIAAEAEQPVLRSRRHKRNVRGDDDGVIDMIDRRMEELRMRHTVISESRQIWHSMVRDTKHVGSTVSGGEDSAAAERERMSIKRNIEREAKSLKEEVRSLKSLKLLSSRVGLQNGDANLMMLLSSMEQKQDRQQQRLGSLHASLTKLRMSLAT